ISCNRCGGSTSQRRTTSRKSSDDPRSTLGKLAVLITHLGGFGARHHRPFAASDPAHALTMNAGARENQHNSDLHACAHDGLTWRRAPSASALPRGFSGLALECTGTDPREHARGVAPQRADVIPAFLDQERRVLEATDAITDLEEAIAGDAPCARGVGL